jgi:hypothetical protein
LSSKCIWLLNKFKRATVSNTQDIPQGIEDLYIVQYSQRVIVSSDISPSLKRLHIVSNNCEIVSLPWKLELLVMPFDVKCDDTGIIFPPTVVFKHDSFKVEILNNETMLYLDVKLSMYNRVCNLMDLRSLKTLFIHCDTNTILKLPNFAEHVILDGLPMTINVFPQNMTSLDIRCKSKFECEFPKNLQTLKIDNLSLEIFNRLFSSGIQHLQFKTMNIPPIYTKLQFPKSLKTLIIQKNALFSFEICHCEVYGNNLEYDCNQPNWTGLANLAKN